MNTNRDIIELSNDKRTMMALDHSPDSFCTTEMVGDIR